MTGPLIWAGDGELNEFNGKDVDGSIVLMNFNTATRWLDAAKLGARAIIFLEPRYAFRSDAEQKYLTIPVPVPRYYLEREHFAALAEAVLGGPLDGAHPGLDGAATGEGAQMFCRLTQSVAASFQTSAPLGGTRFEPLFQA